MVWAMIQILSLLQSLGFCIGWYQGWRPSLYSFALSGHFGGELLVVRERAELGHLERPGFG